MAPILAVIKKNILSIICGLLALAAIIAIFWPIDGYFGQLQTQVDTRKAANSTATLLLRKQRTLPVLDPLSTDPQPLKGFPTVTVIARGKTATEAINDESVAMLKAAMSLVGHQPLVPDALPNGNTMDASDFRVKYQQIMTFPSTDPNQVQFTLPFTILHAGMPATDIAIKARQDELRDQITAQETQKDAQGNPINQAEVEQKVEEAVTAVPDQMRSAAATNNQMYIAPDAFHINPRLAGVSPPSTVDMFNGQIGLWLLQDVFSALASANLDDKGTPIAGGVPNSRVKHLLKIDFADAPFSPDYAAAAAVAPGAAPAVAPDPSHPVLNISPTGHVSNSMYDVIPFKLHIIVDAQEVPLILQALSRNRFITVLRLDMLTVDSAAAVNAGYVYGDKPVVRLNLDCEELFFRQGDTLNYMPDSIKKALGIVPPPPAAPQ